MTLDPVRQALTGAQSCLTRLARDHTALTAAMNAGTLTSNGMADDPAGTVEWTPVEAAALKRIASQAGRYQNLIEAACRALLEADLIRGLGVTVNTTPLAQRDRCTGGADTWADPTCQRLAVVDRWVGGVQHQLCYACDKRRQRVVLSS